ncbi:lanthionine synthetase LanC family protein [Kitasatospora sp. NPDC056184]|uniref:class III lanthionine synthetase LanKC N-terminal domain-containing protein n=1 Tax=Kitasatospora sp. NPDC056184 TaxID=3345738 RepID=UPI0035E150CF
MTRTALAAAGGRGGGGDARTDGQVGWRVTVEGFWCTAGPSAGELPDEGWKLHVSAASAVGGAVLAAVTEVLAEDPCAFKFAAGPAQLHQLNSRNSDRGSAGKFITVYPGGEPQFRRLAAALHRATDGLPGPVVLSDRPYQPGSLVHYRYGAIAARAELGNDGGYRSMLRGPGGERVEDVRGAAYRCPPWARDPLAADGPGAPDGPDGPDVPGGRGGYGSAPGYRPGAGRPAPRRRGSGGVLLAGRYVVTGAIRHGAKGGVFLGRDTDGGAEVVVKQARAHIEVDRAGTDARAALRHEAALLARLEGQELAPRPVELVEQDDSLFLVQERIAGQPLGSWVAARLRRDGSPDVDWAEAGPMAHALLDLVERVHEQGLVLRDLSPGNVLVQPDGSLRLVDLELAAEAGSRAGSAGTPGYRAPEQGPGRLALVVEDDAAGDGVAPGGSAGAGSVARGRRVGGPFAGLAAGRSGDGVRTAEPEADLYALGGLFFLLATGHDPLLPEDLPQARPVADRLGRWLALAARCGSTARRLAPAVLGLRAEDPRHRWSPARVRASLAGATGHGPETPGAPGAPGAQETRSVQGSAGGRRPEAPGTAALGGGGGGGGSASFWDTGAADAGAVRRLPGPDGRHRPAADPAAHGDGGTSPTAAAPYDGGEAGTPSSFWDTRAEGARRLPDPGAPHHPAADPAAHGDGGTSPVEAVPYDGGEAGTPSSFWDTRAPDTAGNDNGGPGADTTEPSPDDGPSSARRLRTGAAAASAAPSQVRAAGLPAAAGERRPGPGADQEAAVLDRVLHDGLRHLAVTATPSRRDRLWPVVPAGERSDPCNVQHGAAGVLAVLARAAATADLPGDVRESARTTARTAAEWIERRCAAEPVVLPGLHFGRSGAAWALLDAARALDDRALAGRAVGLAARIAVEWPNPDVCHGAAGAGFLQLRFAAEELPEDLPDASLDSTAFLDRAARCGHGLLAAARQAPYGAVWPVPQDFDSALAGITHLGFAHGVAGVGAFLLAAAGATGDRALLDGALAAGRTLAATARLDPAADRLAPDGPAPAGPTAWWPQSADDPGHVRLAHWCSGSSGAGTFLLRLWRATGDTDAHRLALAAGRAVIAGRWHSGTTACHGLAGNGEFLLDLAEATGDPEFRSTATELGSLIAARSALCDGLLVLPDETGTGSAPAYGTGTAGALAFLLRLRHGGPRLWVDPAPYGGGPSTGAVTP